MAATYDDYIKRLGGRRVRAGEDWKDVHQQVVNDYAAAHPDAPVPQASGGGEAGVIGPATDRAVPFAQPAAPAGSFGFSTDRASTQPGSLPALGFAGGGTASKVPAGLPGLAEMEPNKPPSPQPTVTPQQASYSNEGRNSPAPALSSVAPPPSPPLSPSLNAPWWSPEYARAANASDKTGLELERERSANATPGDPVKTLLQTGTIGSTPPSPKPTVTPQQASYSNEGRNYPNVASAAQSPASTTGAAPVGTTAKLTSLGAGTDVGFGVKRFDAPGMSPLFTNMTDESGMANNLALMNRGAPTAQSQAAMDALLDRGARERAQQVAALQYQDQVAQARDIRDSQPPVQHDPNDLRSPANIARRNFETSLSRNPGESARDYQLRSGALLDARKVFDANVTNTNAQQLAWQRLYADVSHSNQQLAQAGKRLGFEADGLDLKRQQVANDLATGAQTREVAGVGLDASRRVAALQDAYMATSDPAKREAIAGNIRALTGKESQREWAVHVTPTTKNTDGSTTMGSIYKFNKATGEVQEVTGNTREPVTTPEQYAALPRGSVYTGPDGKRYRKN